MIRYHVTMTHMNVVPAEILLLKAGRKWRISEITMTENLNALPVNDTFPIAIQTIYKCITEKDSQYPIMMIKDKLIQTIDGPRLFMKSATIQTLPIPCTCVNSKKCQICYQVSFLYIYNIIIYLHFTSLKI